MIGSHFGCLVAASTDHHDICITMQRRNTGLPIWLASVTCLFKGGGVQTYKLTNLQTYKLANLINYIMTTSTLAPALGLCSAKARLHNLHI